MAGLELANAYVSLDVRAGGIGRQISQSISRSQPQVEKSSRHIGSTIARGIGKTLATGLKVTAGGALALLGYSLTKGFQRLSAIDQATHKLEGLGHTSKQVDAIMKNALTSVKGTAFGLDEAATTAAGAVAAGVKPGKDLTRTLSLTADAASIAGTSMGDMGAIFNKVATSNKIQGDVIAQLSDKGIPIVALLSKTLHKSAGEVVDLASAGKINFAQFQKAMESGVGGAAKKSGDTFTGAFANLKASLGRIGANLLSGIFPQLSPSIQKLTTAMGPIEDKAKVVGEAIGKYLGKALKKLPPLFDDLKSRFREFKQGFSVDLSGEGSKWQKFGSRVRKVFDFFSGKGGGTSLQGIGKNLKKIFKDVDFGKLADSLSQVGESAPVVNSGFKLMAAGLKFIANHSQTIAKWLPAIVAGYLSWKAASSFLGPNSVIGYSLRTAAIIAQTLATRSATRAARTNAAATAEQNVAQSTGRLTWIRSTAAMIAHRVAAVAMSAAARAMAAAQWLVNAALSANPISIIIIALIALGAAFVVLWKKSDTFRRIVTAAWNGIKAAALAVWDWMKNKLWPGIKSVFGWIADKAKWLWNNGIKPQFDLIKSGAKAVKDKFWDVMHGIRDAYNFLKDKTLGAVKWVVDKFLWFAQKILDGAAKAFGWIPGVGGKLKNAASGFKSFREKVNRELSKIQDKKVKVDLKTPGLSSAVGLLGGPKVTQFHAAGGTVAGQRAPYGDKVLVGLAPGEEVISNRNGQADRHRGLLKAINNGTFRGLADGGTVFDVQTGGLNAGAAAFARFSSSMNRFTSSIVSKLSKAWGALFGTAGGGNYSVSGGVQRWAGVARTAMRMAGLPLSFLPLLLHRMQVESGGNPRAINLWDSNARAGDPSRGLMQTIGSTFRAYAGPLVGRGIYDPLANIYAAIRYTLARYGIRGIAAAWGGTHGYASGTLSARPGLALVGERGPELMTMRGGERVYTNRETQRMLGTDGPQITNNIYAPSDDAKEIARELSWGLRYELLPSVYGRR